MKTSYLILAFIFVQFALACKHQQKKIIVEDVTIEHVYTDVENVEPPPPSVVCLNPLSLKECFIKICRTEKLEKESITYKFILFETENCYSIRLNAITEFKKKVTDSTKKDSTFSVNHYSLSKNEFKNLAWKEVMSKIKSQIKEFAKTKEFEHSSLAKAKAITILFDDGDLISLK